MFSENFKDKKIRVSVQHDNGSVGYCITTLEDFNAGNITGLIKDIEPIAGYDKKNREIYVGDVVTSVNGHYTFSPIIIRNDEIKDIYGYGLNTVKYLGSGENFQNLGKLKFDFTGIEIDDSHSFMNMFFDTFMAKFFHDKKNIETSSAISNGKIHYLKIERSGNFGVYNQIYDISYGWEEPFQNFVLRFKIESKNPYGKVKREKYDRIIRDEQGKYITFIDALNLLNQNI